jgi:hypothetical protein
MPMTTPVRWIECASRTTSGSCSAWPSCSWALRLIPGWFGVLLVVGRPARLGFSVGYEGLKSSQEPPLPDICVLLAEKAGEQVRVVAERLLCEALDPWPEHVAVNRGPVDPTEGRVGVVFDRELH